MIESIEFKNFKALRDAKLPLSQFTLVVGPNGSGKSTSLAGVIAVGQPGVLQFRQMLSAGASETGIVEVKAIWREKWLEASNDFRIHYQWHLNGNVTGPGYQSLNPGRSGRPERPQNALARTRLFSLDANAIAQPV